MSRDDVSRAFRAERDGDRRQAARLYRRLGMISCAELMEDSLDLEAIERPAVDPVETVTMDRPEREEIQP